MPHPDQDKLRSIRTFPSLVKYLRDELEWPIETDDFDNLTFEYEAKELGIDPKTAANIQIIKQLRPLTTHQPWGIFFLKFEPKRLPVVALRRILSQLVVKKRASVRKADQPSWHLDDLLFISNYGEGEERQITFAHFSQDEEKKDLPTLKVLGWDNQDTPLHLDDVAETLASKLVWPKDDNDTVEWRKNWRSAFILRHREVIHTSYELSVKLAELARAIRDRIKTALSIETDRGSLTQLMKAFQEALVHDLDADGFADMYAQTIAYGLLSARIANPRAITADHLSAQMPVTNPFLKELMETFIQVGGRRGKAGGPGIDFDELGVSEIVELLDDANLEAVVRDFGDNNPQEDPVIHFYELFLKQYDAKKRMQRGVFYTPRPIVSYIVRSVDELLKTEFGLEDGLADTTTWKEMSICYKDLKIPVGMSPDQPFVQILDPATGTGTFLVEVIDLIYRTMKDKWEREAGGSLLADIQRKWNEYVPKHLLPRLHGYELLMAPYAIAHLKIGLKLYETGYRFGSDERARIYLTNALEPAQNFTGRFDFAIPALAHEAQAVNQIKRKQRFTVVIGNPPYSNFGQLNRIPFILELLEDYKSGLNEKKINLDDDFIKFVRFSQSLLNDTNVGALGLITNNVYLDGLTHRRMRQSLMESFSRLWLLDLHGSAKKLETSRDEGKEENVFDIQQGVALALYLRKIKKGQSMAMHDDLWGTREFKYRALASSSITKTNWHKLSPISPHFFLVPKNLSGGLEYQTAPSLADVFVSFQNGLKTDRDDLFFDFSREALDERMRRFYSKKYSAEFVEQYGIRPSSSYDIETRHDQTRFSAASIQKCLYRPFDIRWLYYDPALTSRPAKR